MPGAPRLLTSSQRMPMRCTLAARQGAVTGEWQVLGMSTSAGRHGYEAGGRRKDLIKLIADLYSAPDL
ncbi:hypothetical protein CBM2629_A60160 [Cupriavidus taiwanensis]|nr:hypothetical protein CBM2629_A60160 [Cupriavidus taiwanensis]